MLVNAAGGGLFLLLGLAMVAVGRRRVRSVAFGAYAASFGLFFVADNLAPDSAYHAVAAAATAAAGVGVVLVLLRRSVRTLLALALLVVGVLAMAVEMPLVADPVDGTGPVSLSLRGATQIVGVVVVGAAFLHYRSTPPQATAERRAILLFGLSTGLLLEFIMCSPWLLGAARASAAGQGARLAVWALLLGPGLVLLLLPTRGVPEPRLAVQGLLALVGAGVVGAFHGLFAIERAGTDYGAFGIVRTVGAVLLVLAVVRYDLLGVPLPRLAVRRGPIAAGALAVLFIVAQVAQNFFAAQYGLILGGVVAGAFLFAAQPLQRAIEGTRAGAPSPRASPRAHDEDEEVYRRALRIALRDRRVTEDEEVHLSDLGERLGIRAGRACELRHEVERERR